VVVVDHFFFPERRTRPKKKKKKDGQPVKGHPISIEGNDHDGVDAVPEIDREHKRHGRPRKTKVCEPIDEVVKELLSDFEETDGDDEDLLMKYKKKKMEKPTCETVLTIT
jgi:hypothetical protein